MTAGPRSALLLLMAGLANPLAAQTAPTAPDLAQPPAESKQCAAANRKVDKEQKALASAQDLLAKDKKGRESCSSESMCSRYDSAISATEKRKTRHETRLARFKEDADKACKVP